MSTKNIIPLIDDDSVSNIDSWSSAKIQKAIDEKVQDINLRAYETKTDAQSKYDESISYTNTALLQKSQVQIITWEADD